MYAIIIFSGSDFRSGRTGIKMGGILSLAHRPNQCIAHSIEMIQKQKNTFKPCRAGIQPRITDGWEALKEQIK